MALGLFIGCLPIFGFQTALVVGLCVFWRLDGALAWIASNISNPLFAPALLTAEVELGAWLATGTIWRPQREAGTRSAALGHAFGYLCVGAPIVAAAAAVAGGVLVYALVRLAPRGGARAPYRLPANAPPWRAAVERVAARFADSQSGSPVERTRFHYLRAKLVADPAARLVAELAGESPDGFGAVLDVGTGRGTLPLLLLELGRASSARGIDWDERKLADARRAAAAPPQLDVAFATSDLRQAAFDPADTVLVVDVLHYFDVAEQDSLLERIAAAVRPGGRLLLREADAGRGWRSLVTLAEERFFTWIRFNRGERVRFRPAEEIVARLEATGLTCVVHPAWGSTPFSNVLIDARRPPGT